MFACRIGYKRECMLPTGCDVEFPKKATNCFAKLTFCETTLDCRCFSCSLSAATRCLMSLLRACLAARRAAILAMSSGQPLALRRSKGQKNL